MTHSDVCEVDEVFNGEICMLVVLLNHPVSSPSIGFFL
jgi:hypothetical protein